MKRLGILGGTFDPIHLGHTLPAKVVAQHLSLDEILFIPTSIPPHKASPRVSAAHRASMVQLACTEEPLFNSDERELHREGNSYTVDTLKALVQDYPQTQLYFIIGLDSLLTFTTWHQYHDILSLCHLVVNTRPNYQLTDLNLATQNLLKHHKVDDIASLATTRTGKIFILPNDLPDYKQGLDLNISSSEIRQRISSQQPCDHLLSESVCAFINKNKLYR